MTFVRARATSDCGCGCGGHGGCARAARDADRATTLDDFVMENFGPKREADFGPHGNDEVRDRIDAMLAPMRDTAPSEGKHMTKITGDGLGDRVRINKGMREFVGKTGTVIGKEGKMWRVRLDHPVEVAGVGSVPDDLWAGNALTKVRGSTGDALDRFVGDALSDAELATLARAIGTALNRDRPKEDQLRRAGMSEEANKIYARNKEEARSIWNAGKKGTTAAEFDKRLPKIAGARLNVKLERMGFDAAYDAKVEFVITRNGMIFRRGVPTEAEAKAYLRRTDGDYEVAELHDGNVVRKIKRGDAKNSLDHFIGDVGASSTVNGKATGYEINTADAIDPARVEAALKAFAENPSKIPTDSLRNLVARGRALKNPSPQSVKVLAALEAELKKRGTGDAADGPIANWLKGHGAKFIPDGDCAATLDRFVGDHWTVAARLEESWQILQGAGTDGGAWAARKGSTGTVTKFRSRADAERHVHMETGGARDRAPVLDRFIGSH